VMVWVSSNLAPRLNGCGIIDVKLRNIFRCKS